MLNFHPERKQELRQRIHDGRVELVNAFFLESTVNLSGGEALALLGVEGVRWQQGVFGVRPRFAWTIDLCGTHDQMAQICSGLGLEAMVYTRKNPTGSAMHWAKSPDGSRVLALSPGHYSELGPVMASKEPLTQKELGDVQEHFEAKRKITPEGTPILVLAGSGYYALAPACKQYPSLFLEQWHRIGFRLFWRHKSRHAGRPPLPTNLRALVVTMARENPSWAEGQIVTSCRSHWVCS
jgi:Glycosyl hydrolases family 38 N-terminal domain